MAQRALREFDAKTLWSQFSGRLYEGFLVDSVSDFQQYPWKASGTKYVVKPDQLFGKRGKYGLVGVNLDKAGVQQRIKEHYHQQRDIGGVSGILDTFLVEPFVPHEQEYYISLKTQRDADVILFSDKGGVDIEENREHIHQVHLGVLDDEDQQKSTIEQFLHYGYGKTNKTKHTKILLGFIHQLYTFFKQYGFSSLEINPCTIVDDEVVCLDMVARVDDCESWKQKHHRNKITWVKPFGSKTHPLEKTIEALDAETGASLKLSLLNPKGRIGLILGGGGASVVAMDTLDNLGLLDDVINYGELSGNPNYRHNKAYIQGVIDLLSHDGVSSSHEPSKKKRLCLLGGIANFTNIETLAKAFVDALSEKKEIIKNKNIHILVRRGGVRDTQGLRLIKDFCHTYDIPCFLFDGDFALTKAIEYINMETLE